MTILPKLDEQKLTISNHNLESVGYQLQHINLEYKDGKQTKFALKDLLLNCQKKVWWLYLGRQAAAKPLYFMYFLE